MSKYNLSVGNEAFFNLINQISDNPSFRLFENRYYRTHSNKHTECINFSDFFYISLKTV